MALVKCRECSKDISNQAKACPHCGAVSKKKLGLFKKTGLGLLGLFVVLIVIGSMSDNKKSGSAQATATTPPPAEYEFTTTPQELASAYEANTVAADMKFKGKKFRVEGVVDSINTGIGDSIYITMRGGNAFSRPQFSLNDSEKAVAATLSKGQKITLVCIGVGDVIKTPMSRKCTFA
jgi:hypothetical protein